MLVSLGGWGLWRGPTVYMEAVGGVGVGVRKERWYNYYGYGLGRIAGYNSGELNN